MAKQFYTSEEAMQKLGVGPESLKKLVQDGKLRELREIGNKISYIVSQVDGLAIAGVGDDEIGLAPEDTTDGGIGLAPLDTGIDQAGPGSSGSGSVFNLSEPLAEDDGEIRLAPTESSSFAGIGAGDTDARLAPGADAGNDSLGPIGLTPLGDSAADQVNLDDTTSAEGGKDDTVLTTHGINVLEDSDSDKDIFADPLAQTQIAPELADQVQLDSGSSGSGLLDLTREADDTSLGAELLEEIYPGTDQEGAIETQVPTGLDVMTDHSSSLMAAEGQQEPLVSYARAVEVYDPASLAYGFALVIPLIYLFYLACTAMAGALGVFPSQIASLSKYNWPITIGGAVGSLACFGIALLVTKSSTGPAKPKTKKPKPEKKPKKKKK